MQNKWKKLIIVGAVLVLVAGVFTAKKLSEAPSAQSSPAEGTIPFETTSFDMDKLTSYGLPIMLDFGSESCGPCQQMKPALTAMYEEMDGKVVIQYADVWENPEAAQKYPVQVIPTQAFYDKEGKPFVPSDSLSQQIGFTMYSHRETGEHLFTIHQGALTEEQMRAIFAEMGVKIDD